MGIIRLILALSVAGGHAGSIMGWGIVGGVIAVQAFYIISGFYMTLILSEKYTGSNNSYKLFITNRLLRLYPVYFAVLLLVIISNIIFYAFWGNGGISALYLSYLQTGQIDFIPWLFLLSSNLLLIGQDVVSFMALNIDNGSVFFTSYYLAETHPLYMFLFVPQAWTIGLEIMFYLIAPFLVRIKSSLLILIISASLLIRIIIYSLGYNHDPWTYRFFPTEIAFFLAGSVAYKLYKSWQIGNLKLNYQRGVFIFLLAFTVLFSFVPMSFQIKQWIYYLIFFVSIPIIFNLSKKSKFDRFVGELSYPVYISHMLIIEIGKNLKIDGYYFGLIVVIVSILFSLLLIKYVINPVDRFRQLRLSQT